MSTIAENIQEIQNIIKETAIRCGRDPRDISLMTVSKTKPMSMLLEAYDAGMRLFGENRVLEAVEKRKELPTNAEIHLIGHLQSNKAKIASGKFTCIQSVDSVKIARKINDYSAELGVIQDILIELKTSDEEAKSGYSDEHEFYVSLAEMMSMKNLRIRGLMTIAPFVDDEDIIRNSFRKCRLTFDRCREIYPHADLSVLSMGMSGDYQIAIEEGATLVRVGSSIFGTR